MNDPEIHKDREIPQTRNVRYMQRTQNNSDLRDRPPRNLGRNRDSNGWGSVRTQEHSSLNPGAQEFEPRTGSLEDTATPSGRGQETGCEDELNT
jgi:hypothetical protein